MSPSPLRLLRHTLLLAGWLSSAALSCAGVRASSVPLGGTRQQEAQAKTAPSASASAKAPDVTPEEEAKAEKIDAPVAPAQVSSAAPAQPAAPAAPAALQVKAFTVGQTWTRVYDATFDMKLGPVEMRMVNHQETRFEVLAVKGDALEKVALEYLVDTSKMTAMGQEQGQPSVLAGKRYVATFPGGKADVKAASGGTPSKKELDTVNDDAREPVEMMKALKELAGLAAKGKGDFSAAGALALAGGEDDDTKISGAKASLRQLTSGSRGEKAASVDLGYTVTNTAEDDVIIVVTANGTLTVLDAPARYSTLSLQGPMELKPTKPGGPQGTGLVKLSMSYK